MTSNSALRMRVSFSEFVEAIRTDRDGGPTSALSVDDFLLCEPVASSVFKSQLTKTNKLWTKQYKKLFGEQGLKVADLQQNPAQRPRWGGNCMPTLTTGCTKIINVHKDQLYSWGPRQFFRFSDPFLFF